MILFIWFWVLTVDLFNVRSQYELLSCFPHGIYNSPAKKIQMVKLFPPDNCDPLEAAEWIMGHKLKSHVSVNAIHLHFGELLSNNC